MNNGAIFDPESHYLMVSANVDDVKVIPTSGGMVTVSFRDLLDGIEIIHDSDRIWWPV